MDRRHGDDELDAHSPNTVKVAEVGAGPAWATQTVGATLTVLTGGDAGRIIQVGPDGGVIGRGDTVDFPFEDVSISRHHARLERHGEHYRLTDLDSLNGTFVDGHLLDATRELPPNCRLQIATHTMLAFAEVDELGAMAIEKLSRSMMTDPLTGTGNRLHLEHRLDQEVHYARRHGESLGLLLLDLDHFKRINDEHGHPAGDQVLAGVGATLLASVRTEDSVFRYGGEEFCVLVRTTDPDGLRALAERIRKVVAAQRFSGTVDTLRITVSIGGAILAGGEGSDQRQLVLRADQALYRAKHDGRDRYLLYDPALDGVEAFTAGDGLRGTVEE